MVTVIGLYAKVDENLWTSQERQSVPDSKSILVVDNDRGSRQLFSRLLSHTGSIIREDGSASEAAVKQPTLPRG
jgi:hypothetical protein